MTKEQLLDRKEQLEKEVQQVIANMNAYLGAIQEIEYWLSQITVEDETK